MDVRAMLAAVWDRKVRIVTVTLILLALTYGILMFVPKMYESTAGILVEPRDNVYTRASGDTSSNLEAATGDNAISSQIELIQSRDTLLSVIDSEHLRDIPEFTQGSSSPLTFVLSLLGKKQAQSDVDEVILHNLKDRLSVVRARDSLVINVGVRSTNPQLAAQLANAIARAHVQRRAALSLSDTAEASVWLDEQIKDLRTKVADAESKVAAFKVDNDLYVGNNNTSLLDQQLSEVAGQITAAQERKNSAQSRANLIRGLLAAGQPIDGVTDVQNSATIQQLTQQRAQLQGEKAQKLATLLPNHPEVQSVVAQIAEIDKQISAEGRRVADALEAEAKVEGNLETSLRADLDRLKSGAANATKQTVTLEALERDAKASRDLLESYLLRYRDAASRTNTNSALPDVRVITEAAASVSPASPKVTLILAAVGIVALVLQIGSILFGELMSGRALADRGDILARRGLAPVRRTETVREVVEEMPAVAAPQQAFIDEPEVAPAPTSQLADEPEPAIEPETQAEYEPEPAMSEDRFSNFAGDAFLSDLAQDEPETAARLAAGVETAAPLAADSDLPIAEPQDAIPPTVEIDPYELENLAADIGLGRVRVVMLAGLAPHRDVAALADRLVAETLRRGLSVARIDAGSGRPSDEPGLTDLAADLVSFGDVVHKSMREGLAEVPWGQQTELDGSSAKPVTLIEALADIYEVVIVLSGRIDRSSALSMFTGIECRLVFVAGADTNEVDVADARIQAERLGYDPAQLVAAPDREAQVA
jgi:uncharacterized protein involved in exopolysaccharide biosynthesis